MLSHLDDRQYQAVRRLLLNEDFKVLVEYLEHQRDHLRENCEVAPDDTRLRWFQGGAQCLTKLLKSIEEERSP